MPRLGVLHGSGATLPQYNSDFHLVLQPSYNAGEQTVNRYKGVPPYAETQAYVRKVREVYKQEEHPYDARVTEPSPELLRGRSAKAN